MLQGKDKATRGESFRVAVALGIKDKPPIEDAPEFIRRMLAVKEPEGSKVPTPSLVEIAIEQPTEFCHQRLTNERKRVGLDPDELATLAGVSRATQYDYDAGTSSPTVAYLAKIQDVINVRCVLFDDSGRIK